MILVTGSRIIHNSKLVNDEIDKISPKDVIRQFYKDFRYCPSMLEVQKGSSRQFIRVVGMCEMCGEPWLEQDNGYQYHPASGGVFCKKCLKKEVY